MPKNTLHDTNSRFLDKAQLKKLKLKAIRAGVWFKTLPRIDRALVDVTIKVAGIVRSFTLAQKVLAVIQKLENVMESKFHRAVRENGFPIARRLGSIAEKWGNPRAKNWQHDEGFAKYLGAMFFNTPGLFNG